MPHKDDLDKRRKRGRVRRDVVGVGLTEDELERLRENMARPMSRKERRRRKKLHKRAMKERYG